MNDGRESKADDSKPDLKWVVEWLVEREGQRRTAALLGVNRKTVALALRRERLTGRMTLAVQRLMANLDDPGWEKTTPLDRLEARMRLAVEAVDDLARLVERLTRRVEALEAAQKSEDVAGGQESVDEFYSENLAQEVVRGMREAASRGFFLGSKAPFGYKRVKISDGAKERPTLKVDSATAPIVKEIFESSLRGNGLKEICKELNDRGITNRGKRWYKGGLHCLLTNEAYTGTAVWGRTAKGEQAPEPVRVAKAWKPLVSRRLFESVQQALHERAPVAQRPARVGSKFLLSGLLRCGVCGRPYIGQGAKSGQYGYYICGTLYREGAGTCEARYLNAPRVEGFIIDKIKERILADGTITELVTLVAEEIDAMAGEMNGRLKVIWAELADVESRLENLYEALETKQLTMDALSPRILSLRHRQDQLTAAREEAASLLEQRRVDLPGTEEIKGYVADFREFLQEGTVPERKALIRNFVKGIEVTGDEAVLTYTIPMPSDGVTKESAAVLDFVQSGPPNWTKSRTFIRQTQ